jgi:hypothetical protein
MPNGSHYSEQEWREITSFFETISESLNEFAAKFGLVIDKYYHDGPDWTFRFAHPLGGSCHIQVMRTANDSVWVAFGWYNDDYDAFTRSSKHEVWKGLSPEPIQLINSLEKALKTILRWKLGEWTEVVGGYQYPWGQYSKQEWEQMNPKYPVPIIRDGS